METIKTYLGSKRFLALVLTVLIGGVMGYGLHGNDTDSGQPEASLTPLSGTPSVVDSGHSHNHGLEIKPDGVVYACPMNCVSPMEKSGKCPVCGMDLVPVRLSADRHQDGPVRVAFDPQKLRAIGTRIAPVARKFVTAEIKLFGKIEYDPVEQYKVTAFAPGIIDRIYVKRAGQTVRRGDPLFDMHSSELFVLEQDLFDILKAFPDPVDYRPARGQIYKRQMRPPRRHFYVPRPGEASEAEIAAKKAALEKLSQIKRKMKLLGLTEENIERVMARGLPSGISTVITPTTGVVQEQFAFKGSYVNTGETVFTIANPEFVWARLEGYAADFPWIRLGQEAEFRVDSYPGETFTGKVLYLDTEFDPQKRTFEVGVFYTDTGKRLRPNMLVRCTVHSTLTDDGVAMPGKEKENEPPLVIPDTAPLITGHRAVVYVEVPDTPGTFEGREVLLGPRAKGFYVVRQGLMAGERVVINGNFKIDSAVQILAKPSMMEHESGGGAMMTMHHQHLKTPAGSMEMDMEMEMEMVPPTPGKGVHKPAPDRYQQIKERLEKLKKGIR